MDRALLARRNAALMVLEGSLFWAGLAFLQGDTVVSRFIDITTGSIALAGLAATLRSLMPIVGQFIGGMFIHKVRVHLKALRLLGFLCRPLILLMVPPLLLGLEGPAAAWALLVIYSALFFLDGWVGLFWTEICSRTLPLAKRGEVISLQQTFSGLAGLVAGFILSAILASALPFKLQYSVIFSICGALLIVDAVVLCLFGDLPHPSCPEKPAPNPLFYIRSLLTLFRRDRPVREILYARALYLLTLISAPINLVFGRTMGGLSDAQLAALVFMPVIGQTVAGVLWAQVCRRLSYPVMMLMAEALGAVCALMNFACFFMAAAGLPVMLPLSATMALIALNTPAYTGFAQQMIAIVDEVNRPAYIVMSGLIMAPFSFGTYLAGLVVERFGYLPVYAAMLLSGAAGFYIVYRRVMGGGLRGLPPAKSE